MPRLIDICGLDESGRVGEDIIFVRAEVGIPQEIDVMVRNLIHFKKLIPSKKDIKGFEKTNQLKFAREVLDDPTTKIVVYRLWASTQCRLLREMISIQENQLYAARKELIDYHKSQDDSKLWPTVQLLKPLRKACRPYRVPDQEHHFPEDRRRSQ